ASIQQSASRVARDLSNERRRYRALLAACRGGYGAWWKGLRYPGPVLHDSGAAGHGGQLRTRERADALVLFRRHLHPLRDGLQFALTRQTKAQRGRGGFANVF